MSEHERDPETKSGGNGVTLYRQDLGPYCEEPIPAWTIDGVPPGMHVAFSNVNYMVGMKSKSNGEEIKVEFVAEPIAQPMEIGD